MQFSRFVVVEEETRRHGHLMVMLPINQIFPLLEKTGDLKYKRGRVGITSRVSLEWDSGLERAEGERVGSGAN